MLSLLPARSPSPAPLTSLLCQVVQVAEVTEDTLLQPPFGRVRCGAGTGGLLCGGPGRGCTPAG